MKNATKFFALAVVILGFSANSFAQVSATATASATIIAPISISKTVDINFGNIAVGTTGGTVVLLPAGTRSATGGVSLPSAIPGTVTAATFTVTGEGANTYSITLPSTYTITKTGGSATMIVNTFTSNPPSSGTLTSGSQTLKVGATLTVNASQVGGVYTNTTGFPVTVAYN
ncbi:MAG: DUF4402 domain-containing protein [Bacteroidales bacterium]